MKKLMKAEYRAKFVAKSKARAAKTRKAKAAATLVVPEIGTGYGKVFAGKWAPKQQEAGTDPAAEDNRGSV